MAKKRRGRRSPSRFAVAEHERWLRDLKRLQRELHRECREQQQQQPAVDTPLIDGAVPVKPLEAL